MTTLTVWVPMISGSVEGPTVIKPAAETVSQANAGLLKAENT